MRAMMVWAVAALVLFVAGLFGWRMLDHRADRAEMDRLIALQPANPERFTADMVEGLPKPAQRFFRFAIAEGTPLRTVAVIDMQGQFGMGDKQVPNYMNMQATQVLAAPHGFIWKMAGGSGLMHMSGSDAGTWTRFWVASLAPVARLGGNPDHTRAAFGRYIAESVFWTPAALLPGPGITWEAVSETVARVTVEHQGMSQPAEVTVDANGRPSQVVFPRWSDANPDKTYQLQPFGGYLSEFRTFDGFTLPTHVEAGNFFGTDGYFPFFIADITDVQFPG